MAKFLIFILLVLIPIFLSTKTTKTEEDYEKAEEEFKNNYIKEFRNKVKDYLTERDIYQNEKKLVSKEEFKKIFIELMSGGDIGNVSKDFESTFKGLIEEFLNDAFPDGATSIKGSEVHKYFEYTKIIDHFNKYMEKQSKGSNHNDEEL